MGSEVIVVEDRTHFRVGEARFRQLQPGDTNRTTTGDEILILKSPAFLRHYDEFFTKLPNGNVVEIGIAEGGLLIYFALAFPRLRFVGLDLRAPNPAVHGHIDRLGLSDRIKLHYRVDQAGQRRVREIIRAEYGGAPLGAAIDDASHFYEQSKKTFEAVFESIATGGYYCLEDWSWAHEPGRTQEGRLWPDKISLANLLFQIVLLQPAAPDLVQDILVNKNVAFIKRGKAAVESLRLDDVILNRGNPIPLI